MTPADGAVAKRLGVVCNILPLMPSSGRQITCTHTPTMRFRPTVETDTTKCWSERNCHEVFMFNGFKTG